MTPDELCEIRERLAGGWTTPGRHVRALLAEVDRLNAENDSIALAVEELDAWLHERFVNSTYVVHWDEPSPLKLAIARHHARQETP